MRIFSIVPRFENTVTLRGNVANPGRYPWKPGMRVRDLIPNAQALTRRYWRNRAAIVNSRATEYPVATELPTEISAYISAITDERRDHDQCRNCQ